MVRQLKNKQSKQGIILVMVLLIVAMAMIFISAALLLTNSTRSRLYSNAESSQARLTVTAASEAMYQAIQIQEITDAELKNLAKGSYLVMKTDGVAGLGSAADNKTTVHVYEKYAKDADDDLRQYIYMDFQTTIGTASESVRMILEGPKPTEEHKNFTNVIDLAGTTGDQEQAQFNIGTGGANEDDNVVVVRGSGKNYDINRSKQSVASTHIFVGETPETSIDVWLRDSDYTGDMIFYGDYATLHWDLQPNFQGNVYFIGKSGGTDTSAFTGVNSSTRNYGSAKSTWVFINRVANGDTDRVSAMLNGKKCVLLLDGNSYSNLKWATNNATNVSGLTDKWNGGNSAINDATGRSGIYAKSGDNGYKDIRNAIKDYMGSSFTGSNSYPTTKKALGDLATASGATVYPSSTFLSTYAYSSSNQSFLPGGTYRIADGNSGQVKMNSSNKDSKSEIKYVFLDGQDPKGYNIYLGSDYDMTGVMFILMNASKKTTCNIILEENVDLELGYCNYSNNNDGFATGFVSVSSAGYDTPSQMYEALDSLKLSTRCTNTYKTKPVPRMFIYGVGGDNGNHITLGSSGGAKVVCEAFVGLYEKAYPGKSVLEFSNQPVYFYGRIMAPKLIAQTNSNDNTVYYCPDPNSGKEDPNEPLKSEFSVYDVIYYYNNNTTPATPSTPAEGEEG